MTVFNRATLIISQATRKTAADAKGIADEMLKKTRALPVAPTSEYKGQIQAPATNAGGKTPLKAPVKTSADLQAEMDRLTAERNGQAAPATTPPVKAPADDSAAIASAKAQRAASEASAKATRDASANRGDEAAFKSIEQPPAAKPPLPLNRGSHGANAPAGSVPAGGVVSTEKTPSASSWLDQAKGYGSQYVQAMKDLNPYAIGGTALAAGGTAALLHHLLSGKKTRKTAGTSPLGALVGGGTAAEKAAARAAAIQANVDRARGQLKGGPPLPPSAAPKGNGPVSPLAGTPNAPRLNPPGPHGTPIPHAPAPAAPAPAAPASQPMSQADIDALLASMGGPSAKPTASVAGPAAAPRSAPSAPAHAPAAPAGPTTKEAPLTAPLKAVRGSLALAARKHPTAVPAAAGMAATATTGGLIYSALPGDAAPGSHLEKAQTGLASNARNGTSATSLNPEVSKSQAPAPKPEPEPSLVDKAKQMGADGLDWVKKNPGYAAGAAGVTIGGAALLHHLLTKRDRRSTEE